MDKTILSLLGLIVMLNVVSATPITSNQSTLNIDVIKGQAKTIELNITNPNSYEIVDIEIIGDFVSSGVIESLNTSESKTISLQVLTDEVGTLTRTLSIRGFREIACSSLSNEVENIIVTTAGASPRDLEICKDSSISFDNEFGSSVRVVIEDLSLDELIPHNESYVYRFITEDSFTYRLEPLIDVGVITVVNTEQKVHNSEDDGSIVMHLTSTFEDTNISLEFNKMNFSMDYNAITSAFFIIKNNGDVTAEDVEFFGDWISFDKNNLDLEPGEEKAVNFVISPEITGSDDTGKTHTKEVIVAGDNIGEMRYDINIFVHESDLVGGNFSSPEWWLRRKAFCDAFPTAPDCLTEPNIIYRDRNVYDCPPVLANVSPKDVQSSLQECNHLRDDFTDFSNNVKLDLDSVKESTALGITNDNNLSASFGENLKTVEGMRNLIYFVLGTLMLLGTAGGAGYVAFMYYQSRKRKLQTKI